MGGSTQAVDTAEKVAGGERGLGCIEGQEAAWVGGVYG